jgi:hypothetical protein
VSNEAGKADKVDGADERRNGAQDHRRADSGHKRSRGKPPPHGLTIAGERGERREERGGTARRTTAVRTRVTSGRVESHHPMASLSHRLSGGFSSTEKLKPLASQGTTLRSPGNCSSCIWD